MENILYFRRISFDSIRWIGRLGRSSDLRNRIVRVLVRHTLFLLSVSSGSSYYLYFLVIPRSGGRLQRGNRFVDFIFGGWGAVG